jgi:hypothetical protein
MVVQHSSTIAYGSMMQATEQAIRFIKRAFFKLITKLRLSHLALCTCSNWRQGIPMDSVSSRIRFKLYRCNYQVSQSRLPQLGTSKLTLCKLTGLHRSMVDTHWLATRFLSDRMTLSTHRSTQIVI